MQHPAAFPPFQPFAGSGPEEIPLKLFPLEEQVMVALAHCPGASVPNLSCLLGVGEKRLYEACTSLEGQGLIAHREMGVTRDSIRRFWLSRLGVLHVTKPCEYEGLIRPALPLTRQLTEDGVLKQLDWVPLTEVLYEAIPHLLTSGLAQPFRWESFYAEPATSSLVWLGIPALTEVRWVYNGRLHVVLTWRVQHPDKRPRYYSLPIFGAGLLPQEDYLKRSLRLGSRVIRAPRYPDDDIWWDIAPPVVGIGVDEFAAWRARWAYGDDVSVGSMDPEGHLVWAAAASHSEWTVEASGGSDRVLGNPERAIREKAPAIAKLRRREYRILSFMAQFRAARPSHLARAFHMGGGAVKRGVGLLVSEDLVVDVDGNLYLTAKGVALLAARDRIDGKRLVEVTYEDPRGAAAVRERRHDEAVAEGASYFMARGLEVAVGWRWVVSWEGGQLVPDLWVLIQAPDSEHATWVPVELEFSATTPARISEEKLRSYRLALEDLRQDYPILVITGEPQPAALFDDLAGDLTIFCTTLAEFRKGIWEGPDSVWRQHGRPVDLYRITRRYRPHLWQETGRTVDTSTPPDDVWQQLLARESIWEDPQTEGLQEWAQDLLPPDVGKNEGSSLAGPAVKPSAPTRPVAPASKPVTTPARVQPQPPAAPAPAIPTPPAQSVQDYMVAPLPWHLARQRRPVLSKINVAVEIAYAVAERRLQRDEGMSGRERACLERVMATITYGVALHQQLDEAKVKVIVDMCLRAEDAHVEAKRSAGFLKWLTAPAASVDPRSAFRALTKERSTHVAEARRLFSRWCSAAGKAVRAARKEARTLQSGADTSDTEVS